MEGVVVKITAAEGQMFPTDAQRCPPFTRRPNLPLKLLVLNPEP